MATGPVAACSLALLSCAFAAPASGTTLDAPGSAASGESVAVTAEGLETGTRYGLFLARDNTFGLACVARIARRTTGKGEPTVFSGIVPAALRCPAGIPAQVPEPPVAPVPVEPGRGYRFVVCDPDGEACDEAPVADRHLAIVPAGRECARVAFTPDSDHGAFNLHARNVGCDVARRIARGSEDGDLRYRRAGLRCRGVFDDAGLGQTVYRCTSSRARVTFARA